MIKAQWFVKMDELIKPAVKAVKEGEIKLITREPQSLPEYEITTRYFQMLEASIRRRPEFWLWSHNRWKRGRAEFNEKFEVINGKVIPKGEEAERLRQLEAERKRKRK